VQGIVDDADTVEDAQDSEHRSMRGITNDFRDYPLVVGVQFAVAQARCAASRM
jgi:hypothetical protein